MTVLRHIPIDRDLGAGQRLPVRRCQVEGPHVHLVDDKRVEASNIRS